MANKSGTTTAAGAKARASSTSGVRHGPADKNLQPTAAKRPAPALGAKMSPIKGSNKGGIC